jgi:hypothetical protein
MARTVLLYDGIEYEIAETDAPSLRGAVRDCMDNPNWLAIAIDGGVVQVFVSPGVNIAIRVDQPQDEPDEQRTGGP